MRRFITIGLVIAISLAGAAIAQVVQAPEPFVGEYDMQPGVPDYTRNYPPEARRRGVQGAAIICCVAREDRRITCASPFEWPEGQGFGEASIGVSREFRLSAQSYAAYRENPGNWIRRIIVWRLAGAPSPEHEQAMELIREINQQACLPASNAAPADNAPDVAPQQ